MNQQILSKLYWKIDDSILSGCLGVAKMQMTGGHEIKPTHYGTAIEATSFLRFSICSLDRTHSLKHFSRDFVKEYQTVKWVYLKGQKLSCTESVLASDINFLPSGAKYPLIC